MKQFLKDAGLTLGAFIVLVIIVDMWGPHSANAYSYKRGYWDKHAAEIETLVMGHSLAEVGIDASVFGERAWCSAISGRQIYYDMKLLEHYLPQMECLKTVVLPLHPNICAYPRFDTLTEVGRNRVYAYYRYFGITTDTLPYGLLYRSAIFSDHFNYHAFTRNEYNEYGNMPMSRIYDGKRDKENFPVLFDIDRCIVYLITMADMLAPRGIRFIVVTPPCADTLLKECPLENELALQAIADSVNRHSLMEYHNYLHDPEFRNDSLYWDWVHLNSPGGTLFAQRIKADFGL
ncbi:MAG: hypothetical protein IJU19_00030 [Bacteroidales bacterium]|nr:hypothetical protein [Bacteroidales bacterium]